MLWFEHLDKEIREYLPDLTVLAEEPLLKYTSFRIGGNARRMAFPRRAEQLVLLLNFASQCGAIHWCWATAPMCCFPMRAWIDW